MANRSVRLDKVSCKSATCYSLIKDYVLPPAVFLDFDVDTEIAHLLFEAILGKQNSVGKFSIDVGRSNAIVDDLKESISCIFLQQST